MGCGASKDDIEKYNLLRAERDQLALEKADLIRKIEMLEFSIRQMETKSNEQLNLYRFKIEVLVQMLAIEEKKQQAVVKRLETLKLALLNQGISNKTMSNILSQSVDQSSAKNDEKSILLTSAFDLSGALGRMSEEMKSGVEDIIYSFADTEGKIVSALPREDFMRYLYNATDTLTKADVQILSLRFYDGQTVCVPEFIDFFTQCTNSRVARSAAAAVRASLNLLQLEDNITTSISEHNIQERSQISPGTQTRLHVAVQRLVNLWSIVGESLRCEFNDIEQNVGGGHVVSVQTFKEVLCLIAGQNRNTEFHQATMQQNGRQVSSKTEWLNDDDVNFIASRFELGDRVDVKVFFDFFQDSEGRDAQSLTCEPFKFSQEWSTLRQSVKRDLVTHESYQSSSEGEEVAPKVRSKWEVARNARKQLAVINKMKGSNKNKSAVDTKPPLGRHSPEIETPVTPRKEIVKDAPVTPRKEIVKDSDSPAPLVKRKSSKLAKQSLVITYSRDQQGFEEELEKRVEAAGFLFTKATLKLNLMDLSPLTSEKEIDSFVNDLRYPGGTVSSTDVVTLLKERWEELNAEHQETVKLVDKEQMRNLEVSKNAISSREGTIILLKQQALLDPITSTYKQNPKNFVQELTKATETGKGTALTQDQLSRGLRSLIPSLQMDIEESFLADLQSKFRSKTNDVLISSVISLLKQRESASAKIGKQIAIEEKALIADRERSKRMEERASKIERLKAESKVDSITALYKLHPSNFKKFFDQFSVEGKGKLVKYDELKTILQSIVIDAQEHEIDKLMMELNSQVDGKTNLLPIYAIISNLKAKAEGALKLYKELQKEEKAQAKDADSAAGKNVGGFCGGSTKDVHDPSKLPQPAPAPKDSTPKADPHMEIPPEPETSEAKNPQPSRAQRMLRNTTHDTVDTLTYSDGGEEKSDRSIGEREEGLSRVRQKDGIGFNEPKKTQRIQRVRNSVSHDHDPFDSESQQSADLFDSDDNDDRDPFAAMDKKRY